MLIIRQLLNMHATTDMSCFPSLNPVISSFMTCHQICQVTRVTRWVSLVGKEQLTILEHPRSSSSPVFSMGHVTQFLLFYFYLVTVEYWLSLSHWSWYCLFSNLRLLVTPQTFYWLIVAKRNRMILRKRNRRLTNI